MELVDVAFVLNMTQTEDYKDGIFLLSHWKLQNIIYEQPIIQRKVRVVFMRYRTVKAEYLIKYSPGMRIYIYS